MNAATDEQTLIDYDHIVENGEWLEDKGKRSRYLIGDDQTVWVNNQTLEIDDDF
jgi:hypothetical protein